MTPVRTGISIPPKNKISQIKKARILKSSINVNGKDEQVVKNPITQQNSKAFCDSIPPNWFTNGLLSKAPINGPIIETNEYQNVTCRYDTPITSKK